MNEPLRTLYTYYFRGWNIKQEFHYRFVNITTPAGLKMDDITLMNDQERLQLWEEAKWLG